jgi:hypothetical protein
MISFAIIIGALISYWYGHYEAAFWATILNMLNGGMAAVTAVRNPDWYLARRAEAFPDEMIVRVDDQIRSLVVTKVIIIAISAVVAWYFGRLAGYF